MANDDAVWARVGSAIADRKKERKLTRAEVQRRAGVSDKTLAAYIAGTPIVRPDKERGLCEALGWSLDSIDRLLRGEDPIEVDDGPEPDLAEKVSRLEAELAEQGRELRALARRLGIEDA